VNSHGVSIARETSASADDEVSREEAFNWRAN